MAESIDKRVVRRVERFLKGTHGKSLLHGEPIRRDAIEVLRRAISQHWRTYVVGGAIRDLLLKPSGLWPRDVDVIVDGCSVGELEAAFGDLVIRRTSFGGLHLRRSVEITGLTTAKYDLLFDVWRLEDTWAIKTSELMPTISNFVRTPFLNIDAVAVALPHGMQRATVHEHGFFNAIATRTLEVNNEPNPFPFVCAVRSLILAAKLDFWIGPRLALFIHKVTSSAPISNLLQAQISHYGRIRCGEEDLKEWLREIRAQLNTQPERIRLANSQQRQMDLWEDWPPRSELSGAAHSLQERPLLNRSSQ